MESIVKRSTVVSRLDISDADLQINLISRWVIDI